MVYAASKYLPIKHLELKDYPLITVQLPIYNERYVVSRLIEAVTNLKWPKKSLQILILDDSKDITSNIIDELVRKYRHQAYDIQVLRRRVRTGFKAGALQNALQYTVGKYVCIFDADFLPPRSFLEDTIPVLEDNPTLGIVQARWGHINRDYSSLTEVFALGIDGHHLVEQAGRSALGFLMNFNGSCGILRKEAVVEAGGWSSDTLSEDMDLSYRMQLSGWKVQYLRDVVVPGEIPPNMAAFRNQQARWAKGSIQCSKKLLFKVWRSNQFSLLQKIQASIHMTYYAIHLFMVLTLIVSVPLILFNIIDKVSLNILYILLIGSCTVGTTAMYYSAIRKQGIPFYRKIPHLGLLSLIGYGLSARCSISVLSGIFHSGGIFKRTPKYDIKSKKDDWKSKLYRPAQDLIYLDFILMMYSLLGVTLAVQHEIWSIAFYLAIYFGGYLIMTLSLYTS